MRLTTIGIQCFQHNGLVVGSGWTAFDYQKADAKAQEAFRAHVGRYIKIHPDDIGVLAALGMTLEGGHITELKAKAKAK